MNYLNHEKYTPLTSISELAASEMLEPHEKMERLRDQIRVRNDVHNMKLRAHIGGAPGAVMELELIRLRSELAEVLAISLSTKPHVPSSVPTRVRHAAPTEAAVALNIGHISLPGFRVFRRDPCVHQRGRISSTSAKIFNKIRCPSS